MPLARNGAVWNSAGFTVLKWSVVCFTVLGFAAGFAAISNGSGITLNGRLIEGWVGVWTLTGLCSVAGALFGLIWVLIFKALAMAAKG
ncbi:MAG: hypothetical protein WA921_07020 [Ahrensia sp.]